MNSDEPRARIGYRGSAVSRAKSLALKSIVVLGGALTLASAFVLSVVFLAIGLTVVLGVGGYLWWQTRDLRKQLRARMQEPPHSSGEVIEGEFVSVERTEKGRSPTSP